MKFEKKEFNKKKMRYPLRDMSPGDYFEVEQSIENNINIIQARSYCKNYSLILGYDFKVELQKNGSIGIYCLAK